MTAAEGPPARRFDAEVVSVAAATADIAIVRLAPVEAPPLAFRAGQFCRLGFGDLPLRDYSMANAPADPVLAFHIRHTGGDGASAYVAKRLRVGERVRVAGPFGAAYLRPGGRRRLLAVAGGSGLAPIASIVETALAEAPARSIALYFGARTPADLYLETHFRALAARHPGLRYRPVIACAEGAVGHRVGLVSAVAAAELTEADAIEAHVAGPPAMVAATVAALGARGVPAARIHADAFVPDGVPSA